MRLICGRGGRQKTACKTNVGLEAKGREKVDAEDS